MARNVRIGKEKKNNSNSEPIGAPEETTEIKEEKKIFKKRGLFTTPLSRRSHVNHLRNTLSSAPPPPTTKWS